MYHWNMGQGRASTHGGIKENAQITSNRELGGAERSKREGGRGGSPKGNKNREKGGSAKGFLRRGACAGKTRREGCPNIDNRKEAQKRGGERGIDGRGEFDSKEIPRQLGQVGLSRDETQRGSGRIVEIFVVTAEFGSGEEGLEQW